MLQPLRFFERKCLIMKIDDVYKLMEKFENSGLGELRLEIDDTKLVLKKEKNILVNSCVEVPSKETGNVEKKDTKKMDIADESGFEIKSKIAGTFYRAESPESAPFVVEGQHVEKGDVLGMIEAMKMMNNIQSPVSGTVKKIVANNEEVVGYDELLFVIEED